MNTFRKYYALIPYLIISLCTLFPGFCLQGQDLETFFEKDSTPFFKKVFNADNISLRGNYGTNFRSYSSFGIDARQTPLNSTIYANATLQLHEIIIPINVIVNNLDDISHPFTSSYLDGFLSNQRGRLARIGMSPYYKWMKVHAGHRYMHFSEYTLSNHNFLGGGVELTPGKFRFSAMAGRLARAEPIDLALDRPNLPIYERMGWGMKVGYGTQTDHVDFIVFNAKDDPNSLGQQPDIDALVLPAENLVMALKARKQIVSNLFLDAEFSRSGHTRNVGDERAEVKAPWSFDNPTFRRRISTSYGNAASVHLKYQISKIQMGLAYQRIDPQFRTFGAYFFNDDLENYTVQVSGYGIKNFSFNGSFGVQRNNLDRSRVASYKRLIGSLNANYQWKTWVFGANYSNFQSEINYLLSQDLDSLRVVIVTADASLNISKTFRGSNGVQHNVRLMGGEQQVNQNVQTPTGDPATNMYYINGGYNVRLPSRWHFSVNGDYNSNTLSGIRQDRYGGGGRVGRNWLQNKLDISVGTQFFRGYSPSDIRSTRQINHLARVMWRINRLQSLQLQMNWIQNERITPVRTDRFNEFVASIGFNGQFNYQPFKKDLQNNQL